MRDLMTAYQPLRLVATGLNYFGVPRRSGNCSLCIASAGSSFHPLGISGRLGKVGLSRIEGSIEEARVITISRTTIDLLPFNQHRSGLRIYARMKTYQKSGRIERR